MSSDLGNAIESIEYAVQYFCWNKVHICLFKHSSFTPFRSFAVRHSLRRLYVYYRPYYYNRSHTTVSVSSSYFAFLILTQRSLFGPDGMPCVVLWRPEALDCRALIPPETCKPVTRQFWDSNLRPPASESRSFSQLSYRCHSVLSSYIVPNTMSLTLRHTILAIINTIHLQCLSITRG